MKFKVGDKVRTITNDNWNGRVGEVYEIYTNLRTYGVSFNPNESAGFDDHELELLFKEEKVVDITSNANLHKQILDEMHDTYKRKNADYGNSFEEQYKEYGLLSCNIRLDDKMRRLKQLSKNEAQVKDESVRDTLMDLANYAIMTVMELDKSSK
jgi:hypothetical protein